MFSPCYVPTEAEESSLPTVNKGDWDSYLQFVQVLSHLVEVPAMNGTPFVYYGDLPCHKRKQEAMRAYLGTQIRSFTRAPKILTTTFIQNLAEQNLERRKLKEPYFVRIADLYQQIENLELELEAKQNELFTLG
jgi:hypothetical protein